MIDNHALKPLAADRRIHLADLASVHADGERGALGGKVIINFEALEGDIK
jgi:hypothetical protein